MPYALASVQIAEVQADAVARMSDAIAGPAISLLDSTPRDLWPRLERLYDSALGRAAGSAAEGACTLRRLHPTGTVPGTLNPTALEISVRLHAKSCNGLDFW